MSFYSQGDSHIKRLGNTHWKFWKESLRDTKILFCRRGFKFLYPLRGTNSDTKHHLLSYFSAQYPKRYMYCKSSHCCSLKAEHLNRYMYMYQNHLYPFYMWTPPPPYFRLLTPSFYMFCKSTAWFQVLFGVRNREQGECTNKGVLWKKAKEGGFQPILASSPLSFFHSFSIVRLFQLPILFKLMEQASPSIATYFISYWKHWI